MRTIKYKENVGKTIRGIFNIIDYKIIDKKPYYYIECKLCGGKRYMRCDSVSNKKVISCGCYNKNNNYFKALDIKNMRSGKLVAIRDTGIVRDNDHIWECKCDCGRTHNVPAYLIKNQKIKSCGCSFETSRKNNLVKAREGCKDFIKDGTNYKTINSKKPLCTNSLNERNISYDKARSKYMVQMEYKGKHYNFGRYDKLEDATTIRDLAFEARQNDQIEEFFNSYKNY